MIGDTCTSSEAIKPKGCRVSMYWAIYTILIDPTKFRTMLYMCVAMSPYVKEGNEDILVLEIDDKNNSVCVCIQGHLDCIFESKYSSIKIFN